MQRSGSRWVSSFAQDRWSATDVRWIKTQGTIRSATRSNTITNSINGKDYPTDSWTNVPSSILSALPRRLHLEPSHPIALTRSLIQSHFSWPDYMHYNNLSPIVTVAQNFDSLKFPANHPGRSRTDTYYLNKSTVLRTHTSAHQVDTFRKDASVGYTISADVYRRDAIDRSHYPIFHQLEGARMWDRQQVLRGTVAEAVRADLENQLKYDKTALEVSDPNPTVHAEKNPLQAVHHSMEEVEAMAIHLKRTLERVVVTIFSKAREAARTAGVEKSDRKGPLRVRWVEAYFPFTSPSWELEVFWQDDWLEVLGCGIINQNLLIDAGVPDQIGWAFGIGLERIAMLLFSIPDIRLFWSQDSRFLSQFSKDKGFAKFVPFSKHPACYKDVAFWLRSSNSAGRGQSNSQDFHENDFMEVVREIAGNLAEDVKLVDEFKHPETGRKSLCYRINYRSLERNLTNQETNKLQKALEDRMVEKLGVELR